LIKSEVLNLLEDVPARVKQFTTRSEISDWA